LGHGTEYSANIEVAAGAEALACQSVGHFVKEAQEAINTKNSFYVAISGGNTPRRFYELLGQLPDAKSLPWEKIHLFWVDDRLVPLDSPASNYRLAAETFLKNTAIPPRNVHRIETECTDYTVSVERYENTIREVFKLAQGQVPEFDLIFLGMGVEGHTGSLFPNSYAHLNTDSLACVVYTLDEKHNRITLTERVLRAARKVIILVSGAEKAGILKEVLTGRVDEVRYPIHTLWPVLERITWLVDKQAAKLLENK